MPRIIVVVVVVEEDKNKNIKSGGFYG